MKTSFAIALGLLVAAGPVAAEKQQAESKSNSSKRICRVQDEIGTRFKKRVCATAAEWAQLDAISAESRKDINKLQQQRAIVGQ